MIISIITVTFNSEKTILDTLKSINSQNYPFIEHIVIDGGSLDSTLSIIKAHGKKVTSLISEKDNGIYDALNKGISIARGDIIGFLHSDDIFANENVCTRIAKEFNKGSYDAIYGDLEYVSRFNMDKVVRRWIAGDFALKKLNRGWMPPHPTFYMKLSCYRKLGYFNTLYGISADYDSILRYLWGDKLKVSYIPEVLIKMRIGGASNKSIKNIILKTIEDYKIMQANKIPAIRGLIGKNLSKIIQFLR